MRYAINLSHPERPHIFTWDERQVNVRALITGRNLCDEEGVSRTVPYYRIYQINRARDAFAIVANTPYACAACVTTWSELTGRAVSV